MDVSAIKSIVPHGLIGGTVLCIGALAGWKVGLARNWWFVRWMSWWVDHVVRPLLAVRSWWKRTVIIAVNNTSICAVMVASGLLGNLAWAAVTGVGFALGVALRLLLERADDEAPGGASLRTGQRVAAGVGFALNMLEPPAILLAAGLSLAQGAMAATISAQQVWLLFLGWVVPALLVAAAGESLWMGVCPPATIRRPSDDGSS